MSTYDAANIYGQQPQQPAAQAMPGMPAQGGQLPPELVQAMLAMQQQKPQAQDIARQQQMAQALQAQGMEQAKATSPGGGRAGAPNWAGTLANIGAAYKGKQMGDDAGVRSMNAGAQRQDAMRRYFEALTGSGGGSSVGYMGAEGE